MTISAFSKFLRSNPKIEERIEEVMKLCTESSTLLEEKCQELQNLIVKSSIESNVVEKIKKNMEQTFGSDFENAILAVRSSAVGEDSADASGAGQMSTFLGVKGFDDVIDKIKQCWASHFGFRAVQYRRQLCTSMDNQMAVVVQKLVKAEVAGVLFTRHPDTGSVNHAIINASYGLGESVVSGEVHPDSISVIENGNGQLQIDYDAIGEKATVYRADDQGGLVEEEIAAGDQCCLSKPDIERLYRIGKAVEQIFGSARDIEFALSQGNIYILQARPITTSDNEENWELIQEFDSAMVSSDEWVTSANVQYVL